MLRAKAQHHSTGKLTEDPIMRAEQVGHIPAMAGQQALNYSYRFPVGIAGAYRLRGRRSHVQVIDPRNSTEGHGILLDPLSNLVIG
jgi:hypothetical protein